MANKVLQGPIQEITNNFTSVIILSCMSANYVYRIYVIEETLNIRKYVGNMYNQNFYILSAIYSQIMHDFLYQQESAACHSEYANGNSGDMAYMWWDDQDTEQF